MHRDLSLENVLISKQGAPSHLEERDREETNTQTETGLKHLSRLFILICLIYIYMYIYIYIIYTLEPPAQSADIVVSFFSFFPLPCLPRAFCRPLSLPLLPILPIPPSLSLLNLPLSLSRCLCFSVSFCLPVSFLSTPLYRKRAP